MKRSQQGFTLIELMIVVAIIGILAAIALPAFQKNLQKSKFAESLSVSEGYKSAVSLCVTNLGTLTGCNAGTNGIADIPATMPANIASMSVTNGVITATATTGGGGYTSVLTPTIDNGVMQWAQSGTCSGTAVKFC